MATCRIIHGRIQNGSLPTGKQEDPVAVKSHKPGSSLQSHLYKSVSESQSLHWKTEESTLEVQKNWRPVFKGNGNNLSSSAENGEDHPPPFFFYWVPGISGKAANLLAGALQFCNSGCRLHVTHSQIHPEFTNLLDVSFSDQADISQLMITPLC